MTLVPGDPDLMALSRRAAVQLGWVALLGRDYSLAEEAFGVLARSSTLLPLVVSIAELEK